MKCRENCGVFHKLEGTIPCFLGKRVRESQYVEQREF